MLHKFQVKPFAYAVHTLTLGQNTTPSSKIYRDKYILNLMH